MKQTDPQYKLRLPQDLKEQVELAAKQSGRSMNAEIVARLERTFNASHHDNVAKQLLVEETNDTIRGKIEEKLEQRRLFEQFYELCAAVLFAKMSIADLKHALERDMPEDELDARILGATLRSQIASMTSSLTWARERLKSKYADLEKSQTWLVLGKDGEVYQADERPKDWPPANLFEDEVPL